MTLERKSRGQRQTVGPPDLSILEVQRGSNISQRTLADRLGMAVGAVNGMCMTSSRPAASKPNRGVRPFAYRLTHCGKRYRRRLSHEHYSWVLGNLRAIEQRISSVLGELKRRGVTRVVFYGAGEVMEATCRVSQAVGLQVVGVVDDDATKHGRSVDRR